MSNATPASRPKITRKEVKTMLEKAFPDFSPPDVMVIGIRGYYLNSMGKAGQNDRQIYDDAIIIVGKETKEFFVFNGNTDPANFNLGVANLNPGIWPVYKLDMHKGQYLALCQRAGAVTVTRDGKGPDTGNFGINIHRGGVWSTSSLGCQTIPPSQWEGAEGFISTFCELAKKYHAKLYRQQIYTYVLLENTAAAIPAS